MGRVIAIANQKGGVGKTTTTVNLGACLAALGQRVLVVDIDPQANTTSGFGLDKGRVGRSIYDVLIDDRGLREVVRSTAIPGLFLVPANIELAGAELELVGMLGRETRLRRALEGVKDGYDFILIDCPPSLGLLTLNAMAAADGLLVPIQCEYYALEGLSQLLNTLRAVQAHLNPGLVLDGVVLTMFDARTNLSIQVVEEVKRFFRDKVFRTIIPRNVRLSEAPSHGQPVILYDARSRGAEVYMELAKEVVDYVEEQARAG
ncbi:ParA family protein [Thermaerobacter sp. PB12/4term]|uniref:ParA family protein n=1 Tax=Thermaerobacter sp. PB12/4term TaxID=2293838 RepID=UPI000E328425|nr:AAA family ATPase [Thermaerobacter sp. PB12/4term]QIA28115.1 ParA family protein [Thermaerobacter sp. PB12/4term]